MKKSYHNFYQTIEYTFKEEAILETALTHPSLNSRTNDHNNYERLEFLGDKVLSLIIAKYLMENFPNESEGNLSKRHAVLVSGATLAIIASKIDLPSMLKLSNGEKKIGGISNKNNLENALEALIGAIYLDSDFDHAQKFILNFWKDSFNQNLILMRDPISELQEIIQGKFKKLPQYFTEKCGGLDHQPIFLSTLEIDEIEHKFQAEGNSKKEAQKNVAKIALEFIKQLG